MKDVDKKVCRNKFEKYGYEAERRMAWYLKRAFQDREDVYVINDLRLEMNDDVAQIDHLIVHSYGFTLIESKSVTSEISINELGEWTRHYPTFSRGMPSPINQVKTQADFLKNYLTARTDHLLRKKMLLKFSFTDFKFDILVAISDSGIINREKNKNINEVSKADQVPDKIIEIINGYKSTNKSFMTTEVNYQFAYETIEKITKYLLTSHKPQPDHAVKGKNSIKKNDKVMTSAQNDEVKNREKRIVNENKSDNDHICSKCSSPNVEIKYGRYGYYFKCMDCDGNTTIKLSCKNDACKPRVRKDKLKFFKDCQTCNTSELFFENIPK